MLSFQQHCGVRALEPQPRRRKDEPDDKLPDREISRGKRSGAHHRHRSAAAPRWLNRLSATAELRSEEQSEREVSDAMLPLVFPFALLSPFLPLPRRPAASRSPQSPMAQSPQATALHHSFQPISTREHACLFRRASSHHRLSLVSPSAVGSDLPCSA